MLLLISCMFVPLSASASLLSTEEEKDFKDVGKALSEIPFIDKSQTDTSIQKKELIPEDTSTEKFISEHSTNNSDIATLANGGQWIQAADGRWWYQHADGSYTTNGWELINGKWYYFDAQGWMLTRSVKVSNIWYYLEPTGEMRTSPLYHNGSHYTFYSSGALQSTKLGVVRQKQQMGNWCWVACAVMVGRYDLPASQQTITQSDAVRKVKGGVIDEVGSPTDKIKALEYVSHYTKIGMSIGSPVNFDGAVNGIDLRKPFILSMGWNSGGGHAIVCAGYSKSTRELWIIDPANSIPNQYYNLDSLIKGTKIASGTGKYRSTVLFRYP